MNMSHIIVYKVRFQTENGLIFIRNKQNKYANINPAKWVKWATPLFTPEAWLNTSIIKKITIKKGARIGNRPKTYIFAKGKKTANSKRTP